MASLWRILAALAPALVPASVFAQAASIGEARGTLVLPRDEGKFPAVVVLHTCAGWQRADDDWVDKIKGWGYAVLKLDSFAPRSIPGDCDGKRLLPMSKRAVDVMEAVKFLRTQPNIDGARIAVFGRSHGAGTVLWSAQRGIMRTTGTEPYAAAVALYPHCAAEMKNFGVKTAILIGEKDDWTPAEHCKAMMENETAKKMVSLTVFDGAYHSYDVPGPARRYGSHFLSYDGAAARATDEQVKAFLAKELGTVAAQ